MIFISFSGTTSVTRWPSIPRASPLQIEDLSRATQSQRSQGRSDPSNRATYAPGFDEHIDGNSLRSIDDQMGQRDDVQRCPDRHHRHPNERGFDNRMFYNHSFRLELTEDMDTRTQTLEWANGCCLVHPNRHLNLSPFCRLGWPHVGSSVLGEWALTRQNRPSSANRTNGVDRHPIRPHDRECSDARGYDRCRLSLRRVTTRRVSMTSVQGCGIDCPD